MAEVSSSRPRGEVCAPGASLDEAFTDPPYFGNVQYGELMDYCYVRLRSLVSKESEGSQWESTRAVEELTGNVEQLPRFP